MSEQSSSDDLTRSESATPVAIEPKPSSGRWKRKQLAGLILILVGVIFLLSNFGLFWWWDWHMTWPVIIMGVGLFLLVGNKREKEAR